jgi:hypothetical protein
VAAATASFSSKASISPAQVRVSKPAAVSFRLTSKSKVTNCTVDVEVYNSRRQKIAQRVWDAQNFTPGQQRSYKWSGNIPAKGTYIVKVGVFAPQWKSLYHWNDRAAVVTVK